jgi:hypothetical protein
VNYDMAEEFEARAIMRVNVVALARRGQDA